MILKVVLPTNIFSDINNLREKTVRVANLVRALYLFRVNELVLFSYEKEDEELYKLIKFFQLPSYLRKFVFKKNKSLRYVGVAPPIRSILEDSDKYRIGVVFNKINEKVFINAGLKDSVIINYEGLREGQIVKLIKESKEWRISKNNDFPIGFGVKVIKNLIDFIIEARKKGFVVIATSRHGKVLTLKELSEIKYKLTENLILLFGSPKEGLFEIFEKWGKDLKDYADYIYNFFPNQGVKTIRSDEAVFGVLSILNLLIA